MAVDPVTAFMTKFRSELLTIEDVTACIGADDEARLFNSIVPDGARMTYAVFQVVPLGDNFGQARTSIQTRLLVDLTFVSGLPVDDKIPAAVIAAKEHFRESNTYDQDGYRISIRHDRPIELPERGATPDDVRIRRGGTYAVWISGTSD